MVTSAVKAGIDMITNLTNQIILEGITSTGRELSNIANCYKGTRDALNTGNYRGLKSRDQILKIIERFRS